MLQPVWVSISGIPAEVLYAGTAPRTSRWDCTSKRSNPSICRSRQTSTCSARCRRKYRQPRCRARTSVRMSNTMHKRTADPVSIRPELQNPWLQRSIRRGWAKLKCPGHSQAVLPDPGSLILERIDRDEEGFEIVVSTRHPAGCPLCQRPSTARHSGYVRRLADLPWQGLSVRICMSVHRYRCRNHDCPRKIFCERVPGVARVHGRSTERLEQIVAIVGYVAGGLQGSRLLERLSVRASDERLTSCQQERSGFAGVPAHSLSGR